MSLILVVDDVKIERIHVTGILKRNGYTVVEAEDGNDAIQKAEQYKPDMIIMDIVMPKRDGFNAAKRIRMNPSTKHIPIVVVSSKGQDSDIRRATMVGANGYLIKPVTAAMLMEKVKEFT